MGRTVYHGYYPKKCIDKEIIPYLKVECDEWYDCSYNGKNLDRAFYNMVHAYGEHYEHGDCYVIANDNVMDFVGNTPMPQSMEDYILENYNPGKDLIFWMR